MVEIIAGKKGKGKTKYLLDKVNTSVESASGNIVYLDYDLQEMYLDSFLTIANLADDQLVHAIEKLDIISEKFNVKFVLSVSKDEADLPECAKARLIVSL